MRYTNKFITFLLSAAILLSFAGCRSDSTGEFLPGTSQTHGVTQPTGAAESVPAEISPTGTAYADSGNAAVLDPTSLPAYSGTAYTIVNQNQPNFSAAELTTTGYEHYSSLDNYGRCGAAIASCCTEIMPAENEERGSIRNVYPSGWVQARYDGISGGYLWNRCHLIGWQLSAENANVQNLITGTRYMNINGMLPFENMVADYIKETGNHVAYRITPVFEGNNLVCSGVQMEAYSIEDDGEGICFHVYCYNVQPGVTINYATGESTGTYTEADSSVASSEAATTSEPSTNAEMVWISKTGSKYHRKKDCSNMEAPTPISKEEAENCGYDPCKKCC